MFDIIERVRQKKDKEKKIIAFSVAFSICLVIFMFWIFTVLPDFKKQGEIDKKVKSASKVPHQILQVSFLIISTKLKINLAN